MRVLRLTEQELQATLEIFDAALKREGLKLCKNVYLLGTKFENAERIEEGEPEDG